MPPIHQPSSRRLLTYRSGERHGGRPATLAALASLALVVLAAGCDFSPALDVEMPEYAPAAVVRAVLRADQPVVARVSVSRDPYEVDNPSALVDRPTAIEAQVTLWRDGALVETLEPARQTCYQATTSTCNLETGRTETTRTGPFECGAHRGRVAVEPGATYTLRVETPGLPRAQATVTVPRYPIASGGASGDGLRLDLADSPGRGHRYGIALRREYDRFPASVCARGGRRDTVIVLGRPDVYQSRFVTSDPLLLAAAIDGGASVTLAAISDDAFDGQTRTFLIRPDPGAVALGDTGGLRIEVSGLAPVLYDAYRLQRSVVAGSPFAEPSQPPSNVEGGHGLVGAVAIVEIRVAPAGS